MKNTRNPLIFIVEDSVIYKDLIVGYLNSRKFKNIKTFKSAEECLKSMPENPDLVVLDYSFEGINGLDFMSRALESNPDTHFIFLSGQNSVEIAVDIMKLGASDYIVKNEKAPAALLKSIEHLVKTSKRVKVKKGFQIGVMGFFGMLFLLILIIILLTVFIKDFKL
jgi:DNA-binding NtrC family response regulator